MTVEMRPLGEVAEIAGVSYRQAGHWVTKGWVQGTYLDRNGERCEEGGTGYHLHLAASEQVQLRWLARLEQAGLQPSDRTAGIARMLAAGSRGVRLGDSLVLIHDFEEIYSLPDAEPRR